MMSGSPITKVITTRTEEHSVQQELKIPQELVDHPRLKEIIEHIESESTSQLQVLNLIPESTTTVVQQLIDGTVKELHDEQVHDEPQPEETSRLREIMENSEIHVPNHEGARIPRVTLKSGERQLIVCKSNSMKLAHVTSHIGYTKEPEVSIPFARRDLSKQKVTQGLANAEDLVLDIQPKVYDVDDIDSIKKDKRALMIELFNNGWTVLGLLPKA